MMQHPKIVSLGGGLFLAPVKRPEQPEPPNERVTAYERLNKNLAGLGQDIELRGTDEWRKGFTSVVRILDYLVEQEAERARKKSKR